MSLFDQNKDFKVRGLVLKLINSNCPGLKTHLEDVRIDNRVNLAVVVMVVPLEEGKVQPDRAFTTVTKDFSSMGLAIVVDQSLKLDQVIFGFRMEDEMAFVRAEARHLNPMGGGLLSARLPIAGSRFARASIPAWNPSASEPQGLSPAATPSSASMLSSRGT